MARDWISTFLEWTDGLTSPELFRKWAAITAVSGALERRVWSHTARSKLYANLFVLFVAPPGVGKNQAIDPVFELWQAAGKFHVAPHSVTKAALVDVLAEAKRILTVGPSVIEYHSLLVCAPELGVLMSAHDLDFLSTLTYLYDSPKNFRENRRTMNRKIDIPNPQLTILAGTQPGFMASLLPEEAWSMGFMSRIIMIYQAYAPRPSLFEMVAQDDSLQADLIDGLKGMSGLMGCCEWTPEAKALLEGWNRDGCPPAPEHSKLQHYCPRRVLQTIKLSMIAAVSRSRELLITLEDVQLAINWLLEAEALMPDIFREMVGKSDIQVIQDLHYYLWSLYAKERKPIHEARVLSFLSNKAPSEKVLRILEIAERSGILTRHPQGNGRNMWTPRPKAEHGME